MLLVGLFEAFDSDFVIDASDNDIAIGSDRGAVDREQIAVENPDIDHAVTVNRQKIVCRGLEETRGQRTVVLDMCLGQDRVPRCNAAYDGQPR